ncbi:MAG: ABC transporter permease [Spirochaetes bacterium]|nr:ABC transporter permease [Spirochaetota bacterium]
MNVISSLGKKGIDYINYIFDLAELFWKAVLVFIKPHNYGRKVVWRNTFKQILFTGVNGLTIIATVSVFLGMVIIIQLYTILPALGGGKMIAPILILVIIRELGPILTAFIVIGRSGTALSTELGNMKVSHEVDALKSIGIDPIRYLVAPRVFGMVISMIFLGIYFDIIGILGGFIVAQLQISLPWDVFANNLFNTLSIQDIYIGLVKNVFFGLAIGVVSCYHGLQVKLASTEVPQRTTKAVVSSISFCFFFNAVFTAAFYI